MRASRFALVVLLAGCGSTTSSARLLAPADAGLAEACSSLDAATPDASEAGAAATRVRIMAAKPDERDEPRVRGSQGIDIFEGPDARRRSRSGAQLPPRAISVLSSTSRSERASSFYVEPQTGRHPERHRQPLPHFAVGRVGRRERLGSGVRLRAHRRAGAERSSGLVSVHLLTTGETQRGTEATQLLGYIQSNVPRGRLSRRRRRLQHRHDQRGRAHHARSSRPRRRPLPGGSGGQHRQQHQPRPSARLGPLRPDPRRARNAREHRRVELCRRALFFDSRVYTPLSDVLSGGGHRLRRDQECSTWRSCATFLLGGGDTTAALDDGGRRRAATFRRTPAVSHTVAAATSLDDAVGEAAGSSPIGRGPRSRCTWLVRARRGRASAGRRVECPRPSGSSGSKSTPGRPSRRRTTTPSDRNTST